MIIHYHGASYCAPCKSYWPIVNKVAEELNLWLTKHEIDALDYEDWFNVRGVPCVVITDDAGNVLDMRNGAMSETKFRDWVKEIEG